MKRREFFMRVLALVLMMGFVLSGCATKPAVTEDGLFEFQIVSLTGGAKAVNISGYLGTEVDMVIPEQINEMDVISIKADNAFHTMRRNYVGIFENKGLNSVAFPGTLKYIENRAFANNNLTTVEFNEGTNVGAYAFQNNKLTNVTLPDGATLGSSAFIGNPITHFTLGKDITCSDAFSLITLTPYYFGIDRPSGNYVNDGSEWTYNGSAMRLPAVIKIVNPPVADNKAVSLALRAVNGKSPSTYYVGGEYWLPAGTYSLGLGRTETDLSSASKAGLSLLTNVATAGLSGAVAGVAGVIVVDGEVRGDFQAGTIYEVTEKGEKKFEYRAVGRP